MKTHTFQIEDGVARFIYDDDLAAVTQLGPSTTHRVSHVEPAPGGGWTADMSPVGGPVLGREDPFPLRQQALDAEVRWLRQHLGL